ncbi:MAG: M23 family metallopeptidase, partial [Eubacterium sp.]|nr:M23 family metallopeptidase [Eubacterium sp.]
LASGDTVKAGETLGYVGNSGYGKEGTKGKFDVHLHFGMYIDIQGQEVSINPYEILRYLET